MFKTLHIVQNIRHNCDLFFLGLDSLANLKFVSCTELTFMFQFGGHNSNLFIKLRVELQKINADLSLYIIMSII
jgi:hypothetical protein